MAETATEIITIDATPDQVWSVAVDLPRYPEWARDIKEVTIHATDEQGRPSEVEFRASALGRSTHYTLQYRYDDDPRLLGWSMVRGDIQRSIDGAFTFVPTPGRQDRGPVRPRHRSRRTAPGVREASRRGAHPEHGARTQGPLPKPDSSRRTGGAMTIRVGIDVGGTKALGVALDPSGKVVAEDRRPTPRGDDSLASLVDTLVELAQSLGVDGSLGVGVPGLVTRDGVLRAAPNLDGVADFAVGRLVSERLGHPVSVDNDATCATVAEWQLGAAAGTDNMMLVTPRHRHRRRHRPRTVPCSEA